MAARVLFTSLFWLVSYVVWRKPNRRARKMAGFAHTEAGSSADMLAAAEETTNASLRRKYFRHALDEGRHARLFRQRASALAENRARRTRVQAVLDNSEYMASHGISSSRSLFTELGELQFLAFVWIAERRGAEQFDVYTTVLRDDPSSVAMFEEIGRDEQFHIAYTREELDRLRLNDSSAVTRAIRAIRRRRLSQALVRGSRRFGEVIASVWLAVVYFVLLPAFVVLSRRLERPRTGFVTVVSDTASPEAARFQG
jgi:hypothetical protein